MTMGKRNTCGCKCVCMYRIKDPQRSQGVYNGHARAGEMSVAVCGGESTLAGGLGYASGATTSPGLRTSITNPAAAPPFCLKCGRAGVSVLVGSAPEVLLQVVVVCSVKFMFNCAGVGGRALCAPRSISRSSVRVSGNAPSLCASTPLLAASPLATSP